MSKKITITLDENAAKYFALVKYGLDKGDGKATTNNDVINHCLCELSDFEQITDDQVTNYLHSTYPEEFYQLHPNYKA